ncbi:MAG: hypothetical protein V3S18_08580, partial [Dehalococcoidia bacterium]
ALRGAVAEIVQEYGDRYEARAGEPATSSGPDPEAAHPAASEDSSKVAQLLLERAYALYREDYLRVKALDEEITAASG